MEAQCHTHLPSYLFPMDMDWLKFVPVGEDRVHDVNPDVAQTRINLEVRDKFLRRRASRRVAASRLYRRDPVVTVCAEGVLKHWAGLALLLILWLYRIRSKSSKVRVKVCVSREAFEVCAPRQSTSGGEKVAVVSESGPPSLREKTDSHLKMVIRQRLLKSGDVELNPGPLQGEDNRLTAKHFPALLQQLKVHAHRWREIGTHLGFHPGSLSNIEARLFLMHGAPVSHLGAMLEEWIQWAPGDSRGSENFATVRSLKKALSEAGLGAAAHDLKIEVPCDSEGSSHSDATYVGISKSSSSTGGEMEINEECTEVHQAVAASTSTEIDRDVETSEEHTQETYVFPATSASGAANPKLKFPPLDELHKASYRGELDEVKRLIEENKLNPLQKDMNDNNALHLAAGGGHLPVVQYLVEDQALVPACPGFRGYTPLHYAAECNHLQVVQYLVDDQQVDPLCQSENNYTPLHSACKGGDVSIVRYLVNEMSNRHPLKDVIYDRTKDGNTPAHLAAFNGHLQVIKLFISEFNFDPNTPGFKGRPLLHSAAENGHLNIVKYLVEEVKCDPSCRDEEKATPLHMASLCGHLPVVKYLTLDKQCDPLPRNSRGNTPVHTAVLSGHFEVADFFISELNCDPNTPIQHGRTSLHKAAQDGYFIVVKYLIEEHNCNPSSLDNQKATPLHLAAMKGHMDIIKYLIKEQHCNPLCYDMDLNIPLHYAAFFGQLEAIKYFVEELKCPHNIQGPRNRTPLEAARSQGHTRVVEYLMSR